MSESVSKVTSGLKVGIVGGSIAGCTTAIVDGGSPEPGPVRPAVAGFKRR